jgi:uncharacterized protein
MTRYTSSLGLGNTSASVFKFLIGCLMVIIGGYLFSNNLIVMTPRYMVFGQNSSGTALIILLIGIGLLFFSPRQWPGWVLVGIGSAVIVVNVISNLSILFAPTSFFNTIVMLGLMFGGLGLVARGLRGN